MRKPSNNQALSTAARRAAALLDAGQARAALALASRALRVGERADLRLLRARALLSFRAEREARRDIGRCLRLDQNNAAAFHLLCELALRKRDLVAAEVFLRDARRLAPTHPRTRELSVVVEGWRDARVALGSVEMIPTTSGGHGRRAA
jgi:hypothetical protein